MCVCVCVPDFVTVRTAILVHTVDDGNAAGHTGHCLRSEVSEQWSCIQPLGHTLSERVTDYTVSTGHCSGQSEAISWFTLSSTRQLSPHTLGARADIE